MAAGPCGAAHGLGDGDARSGHSAHRAYPEGPAHQGGGAVHAPAAPQTGQVVDEEECARARRALAGAGGPAARVSGLPGGQDGQTERSTGDPRVEDGDRAPPGGELLGGEAGVVDRA